jgi:hypothetical protein
VYDYYDADDANLARRGQVRRVEASGGYWREMDYSGAGWLVRREVQTANGSEVTTYTYDAWVGCVRLTIRAVRMCGWAGTARAGACGRKTVWVSVGTSMMRGTV